MDPANPPGNETTYVWEIENFSMCPQSKEECLKSTTFFVDSMDVSEYQLVLYPRGGWRDQDDTAFCLFECRRKSDFHLNVTMTIAYDGMTEEKKIENVLLNTGETIGFPMEFLREKSVEPGRFPVLPGDLLTINCTITPLYRDPQANEEDLKTLSEDLGRLLQMGLFSDFCLIAEGERKFNVHKVILTVRCRQLAKKVGIYGREDCREGLMDDVTGEALEIFLHHIYTGRLRENLPSEVLNEVYTMADQYGMDDLKRDLFPLELCTVGRTIVKVDHHDITWDLVDFHERVESGKWPVKTFLDLVIGRFVASFSLVVDDTSKIVAQVVLKCQCLNLDKSLTMKCVVKVLLSPDEVPREILCKGEHRFDAKNLDRLFVMRGDCTTLYNKSVEELPPDRVALVFDLKVSHPRYFNECFKMEVINTLYTPHPFWKRSLHRLSSDMDLVFKHAIEGEGKGGSDDDKMATFSDVKVVIDSSRRTPVPSHKCILSARSGHLMSLTFGSVSSGGPATEILLATIGCTETLHRFLRYVYSGKFPDEVDMQGLMGVYTSVGRFQMQSLMARCLQLMRSKARLEDLTMLMLRSDDLRDDQLMFIAVSMIRKDKDLVLKSKDWAEIVKRAPNRARMALNFADSSMPL